LLEVFVMRKTKNTEIREWRDKCRRQLKRTLKERLDYGFIHTYKPVLDDAPSRVFDTMAEYRKWCKNKLPRYLGYSRK